MHREQGCLTFVFIFLFSIAYPFVNVAGQECSCEAGSATTFHLDSILAKEAASTNDNSATAAAASLSLLREIHYRYCELPRTETNQQCGTRLHFSPAPVCSDWKTEWLPPIGVYTPIFWGPSVPIVSDSSSQSASCSCSRPAPAGPSTVFATTEEAGADRAATSVCFSYRQQILNEQYGCDLDASPSSSTTQAVECVATKDDEPNLHRLVLEQTRNSNSPTLYVDYTFYDPVGPSALQTIFPSAPTCNMLHVLQACVGTERNHLAGMYHQRLATSLCREHPNALGAFVYIHHGIQENTILYYNGQLNGWVFVPEQHYCTETATAEVRPYTSAIFQPSVSNEILCFVPAEDGATGSPTTVSTINVQCVADDTEPLDAICRGMDVGGGTVFSQECVSPTVFRQQYSLCRNGVVVGTDHRVQSCYGMAGVPRETYCHDTCGTGFAVCSTTTDSTTACRLTQSQDCHGGVWGWVTAVGCTDARSFVSFEKLCEDGVMVGGLQTSEPVPCETNDPWFTTCHDTCSQFSVCSSASFDCPGPTVPPTWVPTSPPTMFPTEVPTVFTPPTYLPTMFPTTVHPTPLTPLPTVPAAPLPVAVPDVPFVPDSSGAQSPWSFMFIVRAVLILM